MISTCCTSNQEIKTEKKTPRTQYMHISVDLCMRKSENYERMDEKKEKNAHHNKRYGNERNEKNTMHTQHLALNVSSLGLLMVGYIIGVCLPYTKQIHAYVYDVFCFYACVRVLVAAMFIRPVCIFVYTSTTQCQNTAAFLHAFSV